MRSGRQQRKEGTRDSILAAARELFQGQGYASTTTRQVAEAAGVAVGTVFAHFADKSSLMRALLQQDIGDVLAEAGTGLDEGAGALDALLHFAAHLYGYYRSQADLSRALLRDTLFSARDYRAQMAAFVEELARRLAVDAPDLAGDERATLAECLMASYLMTLVEGLGTPQATLDDWLAALDRRCRLLLRPYRRTP